MTSRVSQLGASSAIAVGAGLASALLFSLVTKGTVFAVALAYLSPLPIMIAMIAFGRGAGFTAALAAIVAVFAVSFLWRTQGSGGDVLSGAALAGLAFALSLAAPALWLSYLAAATRPKDDGSWLGPSTGPSTGPSNGLTSDPSGAVRAAAREGSSLERLLSYAVALSATIAVIATLLVIARHGGFEAALNRADEALTPVLESLAAETPFPHGVDLHEVGRMLALAAPPAIAASTLLMMLLNLWLAGRVAQVSSLLPRAWPDIPHELRLSRIYAPVLIAALTVAFVGGLAGVISSIVAAALATAFALQGLAALHDISRGWKYRAPILGLVYFSLAILAPPWLLIAFAMFGLIESVFSLRDRRKNSTAAKSQNNQGT